MKILKYGKRTITKTIYKLECKNCGCIFEFNREEAMIKGEKNLNGLFNGIVICPCCKETLTFNETIESREEVIEVSLQPKEEIEVSIVPLKSDNITANEVLDTETKKIKATGDPLSSGWRC